MDDERKKMVDEEYEKMKKAGDHLTPNSLYRAIEARLPAELKDEDVLKKKALYGHKKAPIDPNQPPSPVKRAKRDSLAETQEGEDAASIQRHIHDLKLLAARQNPDVGIVKDNMHRTRGYRIEYIAKHSVVEILQEFPILKAETQLLEQLQAAFGGKDVHASLYKFFLGAADGIMELAEKNSDTKGIRELFTSVLEECTSDKKKQGCLLLQLLLGEKEQTYVINKDPVVPTPTMVIKGNPFDTEEIYIDMDGTSASYGSDDDDDESASHGSDDDDDESASHAGDDDESASHAGDDDESASYAGDDDDYENASYAGDDDDDESASYAGDDDDDESASHGSDDDDDESASHAGDDDESASHAGDDDESASYAGDDDDDESASHAGDDDDENASHAGD
ncbi:PREDICTED: prostatic spermine-binding protein-like [Priapulus caudatus]|uniref:Prostatic spermine-binding protein-like n=1 Tax=Priapulus caudatus TaxID=37621 RepID=A0ABM1EP61_PRICU|nr:PREDICTED: prostatic spermine-binding protein-like [Priapulus caudatus]